MVLVFFFKETPPPLFSLGRSPGTCWVVRWQKSPFLEERVSAVGEPGVRVVMVAKGYHSPSPETATLLSN